MFYLSSNFAAAFGLNYPEIPDSCLLSQFVVAIYLLYMLVNCPHIHTIQLCHHPLGKPYILVLVPKLHTSGIFSRSGYKCRYSVTDLRIVISFFFIVILFYISPQS